MANINRRNFLNSMGALGMAGSLAGISALTSQKALAAETNGYKALIMIFLKGGHDGADTVIPFDQASWNALRSLRGGLSASYRVDNPSSSRARGNLIHLDADNESDYGGMQFAFPPQLAPLATMFSAGELAVVGSVGPLIEPVTRAQIENKSAVLPARLFSHNDQQSTWMTFRPEGARYGWGGRFADAASATADDTAKAFSAIATGSNDPFLSGEFVQPFRIAGTSAPQLRVIENAKYLGSSENDRQTKTRLSRLLGREDYGFSNYYLQDLARFSAGSTELIEQLGSSLVSAQPLSTVFPQNGFAAQLESIASMMRVQSNLGVRRQVFYVTMGGYDTHANQAEELPDLQSAFAGGLAAFRQALLEIGQWNNTTIFTGSDFGRTFNSNSSGTDHGWGNHQLVMGGSVNGGNFYGDFPELDADGPNFATSRARLIPTISVEQYAAALGSWFGLSNSELNVALPGLSNFNSGGFQLFT